MKVERISVLLFSFLLAFCSLFYELVYAQVLSVCIGGTKIQYLLTISLFTSALGLGSLSFNYFKERLTIKNLFFKIEVLLIAFGATGPFFISWLLQANEAPTSLSFLKTLLSYIFIFIIGVLSGFELPCLFSLLKDAHGKILAFDYLGMLAASLLFPFLFLPYLGTAASTLFVSNINMVALIWLAPIKSKFINSLLYVLNGLTFFAIFFFRSELNDILSKLYLGGI